MPDQFDTLKVSEIYRSVAPHEKPVAPQDDRHQRHRNHEEPQKRTPKDFFPTIARAVRRANESTLAKGLPYRFEVYLKKGEVFIDTIVLDAAGGESKRVTKNVTLEEFDKLINDVAQTEGMMLDSEA